MKPPLRILDTGLSPARWNVAMTAALVELHAKGASPDTVRFHRYPACILLGRSQDIERAIDLGYCRRENIDIARRVTGGGAVFMSSSMLAWDVVVDRRGGGLEAMTRSICEAVAAGLSRLGLAARFRAPNDIEIGDRKVSGSSGRSEGASAILQGTILIEDDVPVMARALRISERALRDGVTCLVHALATPPSLSSIVECVSFGLAETLVRQPSVEQASPGELTLCRALLRDEIGTDEFVLNSRATSPVGSVA